MPGKMTDKQIDLLYKLAYDLEEVKTELNEDAKFMSTFYSEINKTDFEIMANALIELFIKALWEN